MRYREARQEWIARGRVRQNRLAEIAVQVNETPWRVFRNRRLRREVAQILAEDDAEYAALQERRQPHGAE
jgi:hypothetical protein